MRTSHSGGRCLPLQNALIAITLSCLVAGIAQAKEGNVSARAVTPYAGHGNAVVLGDSARIIVVGSTETTPADILVSSFVPTFDGGLKPDLSFGDNGKVVLDLGGDDVATAVAFDDHSRIVVAGYTSAGAGDYDFFVARFFDGGALDRSFNGTGWRAIGFGDNDFATALTLDASGRIVVAGYSFQGGIFQFGNYDFAVARVMPDGQMDSTFGGDDHDGKLLDGLGDFEVPGSVLIDSEGRIIVVGAQFGQGGPSYANIAMARFTPVGKLDSTFGGGNGNVTRNFGMHFSYGTAAALDAEGRLVVVGIASPGHITFTDDTYNDADLAVARFDISGARTDVTLDPTFGTNGVTLTEVRGFDDFAQAVAFDKHGRILVAGRSFTTVTRPDYLVARYDTSGRLDPLFGANGIATTGFDIGGQPAAQSFGASITFDLARRIVVAGTSQAAATGEFFQAVAVFDVQQRDFALSVSGPVSVPIGSSGSTTVTLQSIEDYDVGVPVTVVGDAAGGPLPAGVTILFNGTPGNTIELRPPSNGSVSATLTVRIASFVTPKKLTLFLQPDRLQDPLHTHAIPVSVTITARALDIVAVVDSFRAVGAITSAATATSLADLLTAAQNAIDVGNVNVATATLNGFLVLVEVERGRHIKTSATIEGVAVNPHAILLADGRDVIAGLRTSTPQHPIVGYITNAANQGVGLVSIAIVDSGNNVVASTVTDLTGFYAITATSRLTPGDTYTAVVTAMPFFYHTVTPTAQAFTWAATGVALPNFQLQ